MGFASEVERVRERKRQLRQVVAECVALIRPFGHDEQLEILSALVDEFESKGPAARSGGPGVGSAVGVVGTGALGAMGAALVGAIAGADSDGYAAKTLALLEMNPAGTSVRMLTEATRGVPDARNLHSTRATLNYLRTKNQAHSIGDGIWVAGPATNGDAPVASNGANESATPLVKRVIAAASKPMTTADVIAAALAIKPDMPKPHIYSALQKLPKSVSSGVLVRGETGSRTYGHAGMREFASRK